MHFERNIAISDSMRGMSCYLPVRQLYKGATFPTLCPAGSQREILDERRHWKRESRSVNSVCLPDLRLFSKSPNGTLFIPCHLNDVYFFVSCVKSAAIRHFCSSDSSFPFRPIDNHNFLSNFSAGSHFSDSRDDPCHR